MQLDLSDNFLDINRSKKYYELISNAISKQTNEISTHTDTVYHALLSICIERS